MKRFLVLCFLVLSGCSSVTIPNGVDSGFYKKFSIFYKKPSYDQKYVYRSYIKNDLKKSLVDFNKNDLISEDYLIDFYGEQYVQLKKIIDSKTDYMTNEDLFKNNLSKIENLYTKIDQIFVLSYNNLNQWDFDKVKLHYYSGLIQDIKEKNIRYSLELEKYIVNVRFENISTILKKNNKFMTNGFGTTVSVEEEIFSGYYLKPLPRKFEIPLEISKAKNYNIENLEVLLYVRLSEIVEKDAENEATLDFPVHRYDFRTIFEVQILGYQLRDKNSREIITQGIL